MASTSRSLVVALSCALTGALLLTGASAAQEGLDEGFVAFKVSEEVPDPNGGVPVTTADAKTTEANLIPEPGFESDAGWTPLVQPTWPATSIWRGT